MLTDNIQAKNIIFFSLVFFSHPAIMCSGSLPSGFERTEASAAEPA